VSNNSNGRVEKKATQMVLTSRYIHVINDKCSLQVPWYFVECLYQYYFNNKFDRNLLSNLGINREDDRIYWLYIFNWTHIRKSLQDDPY
jgi:hypothetical protein